MSIPTSSQSALLRNDDFHTQVNAILMRQAHYTRDTVTELSQDSLNQIAMVVKSPTAFFFPQNLVTKSTWNTTYDTWATDPQAQDGAIQGIVENLWSLLVGKLTLKDGSEYIMGTPP